MIETDYKQAYQTPPIICDYMSSLVPVESIKILEPTAGSGNIINSLHRFGFREITAPDNFFEMDMNNHFDCIVMNPPFSSKYAFGIPDSIKENGMRLGYYILTECMKMSEHVIALMPWFTISDSDVRLRNLKAFGIKSLTALPRKTFQYARIQTVVIELDKNFKDQTTFKIIDL